MHRNVAYFVTPHGFGHATRAAAVMAAVQTCDPNVQFHIFTQAPERIFAESLPASYVYHHVLTDLGLVQKTPLIADLDASLKRLNAFLPFHPKLVAQLAEKIQSCVCVCCDIAPLGIAVAKQAGLPSVLIENFTWDWIYTPFAQNAPPFVQHINYLRGVFKTADYHVQTQPACDIQKHAFVVSPVSRKIRQSREAVRDILGIPNKMKAIMITMGGTPFQYEGDALRGREDICFLLPNSGDVLRREGHLIHLPRDVSIFHPDLVNACDGVIGKVGYSTLAEVYWAGVPFGYIPRPSFRESDALIPFIEREMPGMMISEQEFDSGAWLDHLPELFALPRIKRQAVNGADQIATFLLREVMV